MKSGVGVTLSVAALAAVTLLAHDAQAKDKKNVPAMDVTTTRQEAPVAFMVAADATLSEPLDAKKLQAGAQVHASLSDKVQLKNGTTLPKGTVLVGSVVAGDHAAAEGASLVLRFTTAQLKDGKTVPVKVTIVGGYAAGNESSKLSAAWSQKPGVMDQHNVVSGVDLRSDTAGENSGSFVSTGKGSIKLNKGYGLALAIGANQDAQGS